MAEGTVRPVQPDDGRARRGPWQPRGSGLLVGVLVLSVVALVGHGAVALTLLRGAVHPPPNATAAPNPAATGGSTGPATTGGTPTSGPALHLDHACLVPDNPRTSATIPAGDPFGTDVADLGPKAELQRLYAVQGKDLVPIDGAGPVRDCDRQLWSLVLATTGSYVRYLKELLVFDSDLSPSSEDSIGDLVPAGAPRASDASRWRLALAPNGQTDADLAVTLAHEFGHLVSLNGEQLATPQPKACTTFDGGSGCLDASAYLVQFLDATWSDAEIDDWNAASGIKDADKRKKALDDFYAKHRSSFVDSYAATDPTEDFAESFALWCAIDKNSPVLAQYVEGDLSNGKEKLAWFDRGSDNLLTSKLGSCSRLREMTR